MKLLALIVCALAFWISTWADVYTTVRAERLGGREGNAALRGPDGRLIVWRRWAYAAGFFVLGAALWLWWWPLAPLVWAGCAARWFLAAATNWRKF